MKAKLHPLDLALAYAMQSIEGATKDQALRRILGKAEHAGGRGERFDALAIETLISVTVEAGVPLAVKIGGNGNLVASSALFGTVSYAAEHLFVYTPLAGYLGRDQFAVRDGDGKVTLVRVIV